MSYDPKRPVSGGLADLQQYATDPTWGMVFTRLEILAQEKAIADSTSDTGEAMRAEASIEYMLSLVAPVFEGEIPEVVHHLIQALSRQIIAETQADRTR
jgi:hypothetical protein